MRGGRGGRSVFVCVEEEEGGGYARLNSVTSVHYN